MSPGSFFLSFHYWLHLESRIVCSWHIAFLLQLNVGHGLNERWVLKLLLCLSNPSALLVIMCCLYLSSRARHRRASFFILLTEKNTYEVKEKSPMTQRTWMKLKGWHRSTIKLEVMREPSSYPLMTKLVAWRRLSLEFKWCVFQTHKKKHTPELAWRILSLKNDNVEDETECRLEFHEGHWVVWISSLLMVGNVPVWSRLVGYLTVPAITVRTEEKAGRPDKPFPSVFDSPSEWTIRKGTSSGGCSATEWAGESGNAGSLCKGEEPEASEVNFSIREQKETEKIITFYYFFNSKKQVILLKVQEDPHV